MEHQLDKYIIWTKSQLNALPDGNTQMFDTSQLQMMCLEKFANFQGYYLVDGLFVTDDPAESVMTLDNMVLLYNNSMSFLGESLEGQPFIKTVYLAGRNLRRPVKVQHHWVKFL